MATCLHEKGFERPKPLLFDQVALPGRPGLKRPGPVCNVCRVEVTPALATLAEERVTKLRRLDEMHTEADAIEKRLEAIERELTAAPAVAPPASNLPARIPTIAEEAARLTADPPLPSIDDLAAMTPEARAAVGARMTSAQRQELAELLGISK